MGNTLALFPLSAVLHPGGHLQLKSPRTGTKRWATLWHSSPWLQSSIQGDISSTCPPRGGSHAGQHSHTLPPPSRPPAEAPSPAQLPPRGGSHMGNTLTLCPLSPLLHPGQHLHHNSPQTRPSCWASISPSRPSPHPSAPGPLHPPLRPRGPTPIPANNPPSQTPPPATPRTLTTRSPTLKHTPRTTPIAHHPPTFVPLVL